MNITLRLIALVVLPTLTVGGCSRSESAPATAEAKLPALIGAWRSHMQFTSGAFAAVKDVEFAYVFNQGGTLTESSNYDGAPPVAPAYGIWRATGPRNFELKYIFYITNPPHKFEDLAGGGGWMPAGVGTFIERITLSADGKSFSSTVEYSARDMQGKALSGGGQASAHATRIVF